MQNGTFIRIFIASPGDVYQEREEACRVIQSWNAAHSLSRSVLVEPVRVETHSHAVQGGHPQDLINSQLLDRCDLLIAILWSRIGTPTNSDLSGTVQEIREFSETKGADRVLIFFCDRDIPNSSDLDQVKAVRSFKDSIKSEGLYTPYTEVSEFGSLFRHQLELAMNKVLEGEEFDAISARATGNSEIVFLPEANTILAAAAMADRTTITLFRVLSGHMLCAGNVALNVTGDDRSEARWESGLEQLENYGFVEDLGYKREVFRLTRSGFEGVLFNLGDESFLLTAAHVTDQRMDGILHIPTTEAIEPIRGFFADSIPFLSKTREGDKGDVSYYRLDRKFSEALHSSLRPLSINDLDLDDQLHDGDTFTFAGFPWRKTTDKIDAQGTALTSYTGFVVDEGLYNRHGYLRNLHVIIQMRLKNAFSSRYGPRQTASQPQGISGGGVFSWPRGLSNRMNSPKLHLAAIAHTYLRTYNCMVGTRIIGVLIAILRNNPQLGEHLPEYVRDRLKQYSE